MAILKTPIPQSVMDSLNDYIANQTPATYTLPYKTYVALLTQSGTSAPTATVLENTLGFTPVWVYVGIGGYAINHTFDKTKTTVSIQQRIGNVLVYFDSDLGTPVLDRLVIATYLGVGQPYANGGSGQSYLLNSMIEIRVYN